MIERLKRKQKRQQCDDCDCNNQHINWRIGNCLQKQNAQLAPLKPQRIWWKRCFGHPVKAGERAFSSSEWPKNEIVFLVLPRNLPLVLCCVVLKSFSFRNERLIQFTDREKALSWNSCRAPERWKGPTVAFSPGRLWQIWRAKRRRRNYAKLSSDDSAWRYDWNSEKTTPVSLAFVLSWGHGLLQHTTGNYARDLERWMDSCWGNSTEWTDVRR